MLRQVALSQHEVTNPQGRILVRPYIPSTVLSISTAEVENFDSHFPGGHQDLLLIES